MVTANDTYTYNQAAKPYVPKQPNITGPVITLRLGPEGDVRHVGNVLAPLIAPSGDFTEAEKQFYKWERQMVGDTEWPGPRLNPVEGTRLIDNLWRDFKSSSPPNVYFFLESAEQQPDFAWAGNREIWLPYKGQFAHYLLHELGHCLSGPEHDEQLKDCLVVLRQRWDKWRLSRNI